MQRSGFSYGVLSLIAKGWRRKIYGEMLPFEKGDRDLTIKIHNPPEGYHKDIVLKIREILKEGEYEVGTDLEEDNKVSISCYDGRKPFSVVASFYGNGEKVFICIEIKL